MANLAPTKGNLMAVKKSLALSIQGYGLMDKKRVILINEIMTLVSAAEAIQNEIDTTYSDAYAKLEMANIQMGISRVREASLATPIEDTLTIKHRSVMGTDVPQLGYEKKENQPSYSFYSTTIALDEAKAAFNKVKDLTIRLATIENSAYRLATSIQKTQKRANALKNISIPNLTQSKKEIETVLEEKEREEFTRLKMVKKMRM